MATNVVYNQGDNLSWPVPADTESGDFVLIGDEGLYGVAVTDRGAGGNPSTHASVQMHGVFALPVSTVTPADIGDKCYVDAEGDLTPASDDGDGESPTEHLHIGWFYSAKGTTDGEVCHIRLAQV